MRKSEVKDSEVDIRPPPPRPEPVTRNQEPNPHLEQAHRFTAASGSSAAASRPCGAGRAECCPRGGARRPPRRPSCGTTASRSRRLVRSITRRVWDRPVDLQPLVFRAAVARHLPSTAEDETEKANDHEFEGRTWAGGTHCATAHFGFRVEAFASQSLEGREQGVRADRIRGGGQPRARSRNTGFVGSGAGPPNLQPADPRCRSREVAAHRPWS